MIPNMSFCLVSDVNKVTEANIKQQEEKFIERDWMGSDQNLANLMHRKGMVTIKV